MLWKGSKHSRHPLAATCPGLRASALLPCLTHPEDPRGAALWGAGWEPRGWGGASPCLLLLSLACMFCLDSVLTPRSPPPPSPREGSPQTQDTKATPPTLCTDLVLDVMDHGAATVSTGKQASTEYVPPR